MKDAMNTLRPRTIYISEIGHFPLTTLGELAQVILAVIYFLIGPVIGIFIFASPILFMMYIDGFFLPEEELIVFKREQQEKMDAYCKVHFCDYGASPPDTIGHTDGRGGTW